mmetsp:Transcript_34327/g.86151  ORF Transcript_34327/g.86151 Transcript_34327/m.86151 type:complete len:384 (+) Transcript_34327:79-1230(+)|eukprot:CAMPEP_0177663746 /NCGR_PEP_ID=MMETSP0447-20121125/20091_1 /TAXON_ID=0 /ORGANISM="Stygamoeba regulata, Strain BSH-02190019" /LENGTH=383 /DNA_ID=CAMNT_0019169605 /DNA_START=56 /DNA_END=1207 /DNA_ORIENTATION=+
MSSKEGGSTTHTFKVPKSRGVAASSSRQPLPTSSGQSASSAASSSSSSSSASSNSFPTDWQKDLKLVDGRYIYKDQAGLEWAYDASSSCWLPIVPTEVLQDSTADLAARALAAETDAVVPSKSSLKRQKERENTSVIGHGFPQSTTLPDAIAFFRKAGLLATTLEGKPRVKLNYSAEEVFEGTVIATYLNRASVELAFTLLDERPFREDGRYPIRIEMAEDLPPEKRNKSTQNQQVLDAKLKRKLWLKKQADERRALGWGEENRRHVVIKGMFVPEDAKGDPDFFKELKEDVREECSQLGEVEMLTAFEYNPEGVVVVVFKDSMAAELCLDKMDGRYFAGRKLQASWYDGVSDFYVAEPKNLEEARLKDWDDWLEGESSSDEE